MNRRASRLRLGLIAISLLFLVAAGSLWALPRNYCKICTNLGLENGGLTCLNVGSGWGFNNCRVESIYYGTYIDGQEIGITIPRCMVQTGCTYDY